MRVRAWRYKFVRRNGKRVRVRYRTWVNVQRQRTLQGLPIFCPFPTAAATSSAAQTLAHESIHLRGISDEATAECYGRQLARVVITRLGAPDAGYASALGAYSIAIYPPGSPYNSPECRDGGALDLNPGSPEWP